jgi:hypothetical protein
MIADMVVATIIFPHMSKGSSKAKHHCANLRNKQVCCAHVWALITIALYYYSVMYKNWFMMMVERGKNMSEQ